VLLFLLSFGLRILFFHLKPSLSRDIESYVLAARFMSRGMPPFADEAVGNAYPPLSLYLLGVLYVIYPSLYTFKLFFIITDSLIPIMIFLIARKYFDSFRSLLLSLIYAINPLPLIEVGWNGHLDPVPSLLLLVSIYLLHKNRLTLSAFFFTASVMMKWYPLFLLPLFGREIYCSKGRNQVLSYIMLVLMLSSAMVAVFIKLYPSYVESLKIFLLRGGNIHFCGRSISESIYKISRALNPSLLHRCPSISFVFYGSSLLVVLSHLLGKSYKKQLFHLTLLSLALHLFLRFSIHLSSLVFDLGELPVVSHLYSLFFTVASLLVTARLLVHVQLTATGKTTFYEACVLALLFIILGQPAFNPWYLLWVMPFALLVEDKKISYQLTLLFLLVAPLFYYGPPAYFKGLLP
jgi:hypothetical protein